MEIISKLGNKISSFLLQKNNRNNFFDTASRTNLIPGTVVDIPENFTIGENCSFGGNVRVFNTAMVSLGNECMVAFGVQFVTSTHDANIHPMRKVRIDRPIKIGNHVWIGTNAIILPGIIVGDYSIIGAGAVVTAHVPEKAVVVGNPARIVKFREVEIQAEQEFYEESIIALGFLPENKITKEAV